MASVLTDDIRYVKLVLLLMKGGMFVAKKHILRISNSAKKSIDDILKANEDNLKKARQKKIITEKQMHVLFPGPTDLGHWDISLLSYILLNLCDGDLESYEKVAIISLRDKRNTLAHSASTTMSEVQFMGEWSDLTMVLFQLTKRLIRADLEECNDTINTLLAIKDFHVATSELKSFEESDEFVQVVITEKMKSMEQKLNDCCNRLGAMEESNVEMKGQLVVMARILVSALTPLVKDRAQATLLEALNQMVAGEQNPIDEQHRSGVNGVLTACRNLVSDMKDKGMDIDKVEEGSILITFRCLTISALKKISTYFVCRMYEESVIELEHALSKFVESPVKLDMNIVLETLYSALTQIEKDAAKSIVLTVTCRRPEGLQNAVNLFSNGSSSNALNSLAEALSASVGGRVGLYPTIDGDQLKTNITELERQLCLVENSLKRPTQTPYDVPTLRETPYEEPELTVTTSDDPSLTETPSDDPALIETPSDDPALIETRSDDPTLTETPSDDRILTETMSDYLALPGGLSRLKVKTLPGQSTHANTSPDTHVSTKTRQKMAAGKHSLPTAIAHVTEGCSKHWHGGVNMDYDMIIKLLEIQGLKGCMQLKGRRATLHELESCYSTDQLLDLLSEHTHPIKGVTQPLQFSELPCGCVSIDQKTIDQTTKTQPEYTIPINFVIAAGCMTDMAYRVGKGELKNGFIVLPDIDKDDLHNMQQRGHLPFGCFTIAAKQMKEKLDMKRILIFHLGYCPDIITQTATYADKDILYISIHEEKATGFVFKGGANECGSGNAEGFNVNIVLSHTTPPLPFTERGTLLAFRNIVMPIACEFNPEIVFVSIPCFFELALSPRDLGHMITELMTLADGKVVVGQSFRWVYVDDRCMALQALLGKVIPTIQEEELRPYRGYSSLAEVMRIQRKYWPCLDEYQSLLEHAGQKKGTLRKLRDAREKMDAKNTNIKKYERLDLSSGSKLKSVVPSSSQQTTHDEYDQYKPAVLSTSEDKGKEKTSSSTCVIQ